MGKVVGNFGITYEAQGHYNEAERQFLETLRIKSHLWHPCCSTTNPDKYCTENDNSCSGLTRFSGPLSGEQGYCGTFDIDGTPTENGTDMFYPSVSLHESNFHAILQPEFDEGITTLDRQPVLNRWCKKVLLVGIPGPSWNRLTRSVS